MILFLLNPLALQVDLMLSFLLFADVSSLPTYPRCIRFLISVRTAQNLPLIVLQVGVRYEPGCHFLTSAADIMPINAGNTKRITVV